MVHGSWRKGPTPEGAEQSGHQVNGRHEAPCQVAEYFGHFVETQERMMSRVPLPRCGVPRCHAVEKTRGRGLLADRHQWFGVKVDWLLIEWCCIASRVCMHEEHHVRNARLFCVVLSDGSYKQTAFTNPFTNKVLGGWI